MDDPSRHQQAAAAGLSGYGGALLERMLVRVWRTAGFNRVLPNQVIGWAPACQQPFLCCLAVRNYNQRQEELSPSG